MACNVLPHMDNQICSFERWPIAPLDTISDREHRKLIQRFATWEVLARLRSRAATKPITPAGRYYAGDQVKQATAFLGWLAHQGRTLPSGDQADIDTWHAQYAEHDRRRLRGVLLCSMTSKLTHPLRLPAPVITRNAPLARSERMALLGYLLNSEELSLRPRIAGIIVLLYAQYGRRRRPQRTTRSCCASGNRPPRCRLRSHGFGLPGLTSATT